MLCMYTYTLIYNLKAEETLVDGGQCHEGEK